MMLTSNSKIVEPESESDTEVESLKDDDNRLSDDEEYPISESDEESGKKKSSWAAAMAKILNSDKSEVLSKAKKVEDIEKKLEKKSYTFEIEGETKTEKEEDKPNEKALQTVLERRKRRERKENKLRVFSLRLKPSVADLDRERTFKKIATRGVVQLFNAVRKQQSEIDKKLQSTKLESKRDEIIRSSENKKQFLDTLMSGNRAKSELVDKGIKKEKMRESSDSEEEVEKSNWSALRDDFMTGKKIGWDKDDSDEIENESMESDSD